MPDSCLLYSHGKFCCLLSRVAKCQIAAFCTAMGNFAVSCQGCQMPDSRLTVQPWDFFLVFSKAVSSKIQTSVSVKVSRLLRCYTL
jgi:hypothetical protein